MTRNVRNKFLKENLLFMHFLTKEILSNLAACNKARKTT